MLLLAKILLGRSINKIHVSEPGPVVKETMKDLHHYNNNIID